MINGMCHSLPRHALAGPSDSLLMLIRYYALRGTGKPNLANGYYFTFYFIKDCSAGEAVPSLPVKSGGSHCKLSITTPFQPLDGLKGSSWAICCKSERCLAWLGAL